MELFWVTYDVVYTEILGIYMFLLPFLCISDFAKCMKILQNNYLLSCLLRIIFTAILEVVILSNECHAFFCGYGIW